MKNTSKNNRVLSCQVLYQVCYKHQHIKPALIQVLPSDLPQQDKAWIQNCCYQTMRHFQEMQARWQKFVPKAIKDQLVDLILTLSVTQKFVMGAPDHATVNEAVKACKKLKKHWATGLVNKVLKKALNDTAFEPQTASQKHNHPEWWIKQLRKDWPEHADQILHANNQKPPLWLRVKNPDAALPPGRPHASMKQAWLCEDASIDIGQLLKQGDVSVQDAAAQFTASLLDPQAGERILDACAAPGGKSCHLLEYQPQIILDILELDPDRMKLVEHNLHRLGLSANQLLVADAERPDKWHDGHAYDKILLDVPCSASGVVRRNPDMKVMRQAGHIKPLVDLQQCILHAHAEILKPKGKLLYATCSMFKAENERQMARFLKSHPHFQEIPITVPGAVVGKHGQQIITGTDEMDGFYYCLLERCE
ncbi:16S rRNA (cytosine(967)-C(5))-methyltransferase RsmB [Marinicella rhabdoformis]|uniref:16S rRNA (cytosine(967)-C(5))-methyltransferase RsmB n=1 Tax=Marinicella rhabdoformis TaxID=2580566 RepID=UPI0012AEB74F|nr:16S rRNA (cytosine(967)-C(5))-methyltransferase RsmB [Marinicella rhabdoformis]